MRQIISSRDLFACYLTFAKRLADEITTLELPKNLTITISQGIAVNRENEGLEETLKRADTALYKAKELDRNRIEVD